MLQPFELATNRVQWQHKVTFKLSNSCNSCTLKGIWKKMLTSLNSLVLYTRREGKTTKNYLPEGIGLGTSLDLTSRSWVLTSTQEVLLLWLHERRTFWFKWCWHRITSGRVPSSPCLPQNVDLLAFWKKPPTAEMSILAGQNLQIPASSQWPSRTVSFHSGKSIQARQVFTKW